MDVRTLSNYEGVTLPFDKVDMKKVKQEQQARTAELGVMP